MNLTSMNISNANAILYYGTDQYNKIYGMNMANDYENDYQSYENDNYQKN